MSFSAKSELLGLYFQLSQVRGILFHSSPLRHTWYWEKSLVCVQRSIPVKIFTVSLNGSWASEPSHVGGQSGQKNIGESAWCQRGSQACTCLRLFLGIHKQPEYTVIPSEVLWVKCTFSLSQWLSWPWWHWRSGEVSKLYWRSCWLHWSLAPGRWSPLPAPFFKCE